MSNDENTNIHLDNGLMTTDMIDEPLIIVLDEDDDDDDLDNDLDDFDSIIPIKEKPIISNEISSKIQDLSFSDKQQKEQSNVPVTDLIKPSSNVKSSVFHRSSESSSQLKKFNKPIRTIVIDTSFARQTNHQKRRTKSKSNSSFNHFSIDSVLSYITFDKISNILTVSRMGSIYYCIEDLYIKIFFSLCTLDELTNLIIKSQIMILKEVTLSEKISLVQENPKLRQYNSIRYRLISIDSSDYLLKLKQLLVEKKTHNKIIDEMHNYKQSTTITSTTSILLNDKTSKKRVVINHIEHNKRFKSVTNKPKSRGTSTKGVYIQCDLLSTNENVKPNPILTECSTFSIENKLVSTENSLHRPYRSKSLIHNPKQIQKRSSSLPQSIKFDIKNETLFKIPSMNMIDDNYPMPMIVNVEENVQLDDSKIHNSEQSPYIYQSSYYYLSPVRTPYNLYYPETHSFSSPHENSKELLLSNNHPSEISVTSNVSSNSSSPIIMTSLEQPVYHSLITSEKQTSPLPYCSEQSTIDQSSISKDISPKTRMIRGPYKRKGSSSNQKNEQPRIPLTPYPPTKTYFAPLSNLHPSLPTYSQNEDTHNQDVHSSKSPVPKAISPVNKSKCIHIQAQSIDLSRAIMEHTNCDMDKIPKLVVRHRKIYINKTIDTMGQLFPTWFTEPDYRCIHCFNCDQVFTPQLFMTHVDDKQMINEQPLNMTSIQLLTSEKMSEYKVKLWNQFCSNLTIFAREGRIGGF